MAETLASRKEQVDNPSPSLVPFLSLPEELIDRIFSELDDIRDKNNISVCNKMLQRIAIPHIYSDVVLFTDEVGDVPCLRRFAATVINKPQYAELVKKIIIRRHISTTHIQPAPPGTVVLKATKGGPGVEEHLAFAATTLGFHEQTTKWALLERLGGTEDYDPVLATLLGRLKNLKVLEIPTEPEMQFYHKTLDPTSPFGKTYNNPKLIDNGDNDPKPTTSSSIAPLHLPCLAEIKESLFSPDWFVPVDRLAIYLLHAPLRRILLEGVGSRHGYPRPYGRLQQSVKPASSNIDFLALRNSRLSTAELVAVLRAPCALRTFTYEISHGRSISECGVSLSGILEALEAQRESLTYLRLVLTQRSDDDDGVEINNISLREFPNLRVVFIETPFLFGRPAVGDWHPEWLIPDEEVEGRLVEFFPPSIEKVVFLDCYSHFARWPRAMAYLLARIETEFPKLKNVELRFDELSPAQKRFCAGELRTAFKMCEERGVQARAFEEVERRRREWTVEDQLPIPGPWVLTSGREEFGEGQWGYVRCNRNLI
ncbi:hypothetical protein K402DRAFT_389509, partial [Aulographum hederae CBS 113979]